MSRIAGGLVICAAWTLLVVGPAAQDRRPDGWSEATHGSDASPNYDTVFAVDRLQELRITIPAESFRAMQDDLSTIGPAFGRGRGGRGARGFEPPGRGGAVGGRGGGLAGAAISLISRDPIYVPVTVQYDGRVWPHVGMRYKGNSSLAMSIGAGNGKVPFRLDFDRYEDDHPETTDQRFHGFSKLTFSSNFGDDSQLRELLVTEIFRDRGVPAARAAFYRVLVDSGEGFEYWGLYTMIEDPSDSAMLEAQFGSDAGNLYKPDGPGANWREFQEEGFPKKTNEQQADFSDVQAAITALHAPQDDAGAWRERLEAAFDADGFLRWLAVNTAIHNWDAYGAMAHNYYLYGDPARGGRLRWIPWDHNFALGAGPMLGGRGLAAGPPRGFAPGGPPVPGGAPPGRGMPLPFGRDGTDVLHTRAGEQWPLITKLLADEVYAARYRQHLKESLEGLFALDAVERRIRQLHAMIAPAVVGVRGERPSHTTTAPDAFTMSPESLLELIRERHRLVRDALEADGQR